MRNRRQAWVGLVFGLLLVMSVIPSALAAPGVVHRTGAGGSLQTIGSGSCVGTNACTGATGNIGNDSCIGDHACTNSSANIGDQSCNDYYACFTSAGTIGSNSCNNESACESSTGPIGNNACNGYYSCIRSGNIANGTCNDDFSCMTAQIVYVTTTGAGAKDGTSWSNAYKGLSDALDNSYPGDEIWVKKGTYKPSPCGCDPDPRDRFFYQPEGVAVYGGFAGNETGRGQRNWKTNSTVLSGDIGTPGVMSDNGYHVVFMDGDGTLDGFTVTGGNATDDGSEPPIGGGIVALDGQILLRNLIVAGNHAEADGAGILSYFSLLAVENVVVSGNKSDDTGGGISAYVSNVFLTNVTITGNSAANAGGGVSISECGCASIEIDNSVVWNNAGGEILNDGDASDMVVKHSIVKGGLPATVTDGGGNLASDPGFLVPSGPGAAPTLAGDFRLKQGSSAINKGSNALAGGGNRDLSNEPRYTGGTIDIGAYEWQPTKADAQLRRQGDVNAVGNNVYNTTASGQTINPPPTTLNVGDSKVYYVYGQNDSAVADQLTFKAVGATVPGYKVTYWTNAGNDVTSQVVAGTYTTPLVAPGDTVGLTVRIDIVAGVQPGSTLDRTFQVRSVRNPIPLDATRMILRRT